MVSFSGHYDIISIDRLPSKTRTGKDSWQLNNSLLCTTEFFSTTKTFLFLSKHKKTTTLQQVTGRNTSNLVLKGMLRYFLKIPPLKKVLEFQDRICCFIKSTKKTNHFSASFLWWNTKSSFKKNTRTFSKTSTTQKNIKSLRLKENCKTYTKKKT